MDITVTVKGPLFEKQIDKVVERAILEESLEKIGTRLERGGRGLGAKRNTINRETTGLVTTVHSTRRFPRTKGTAWLRKNEQITKAMAPRVLRKTAERIVSELG